jgi:SAM-dependent methyltransferase
MSPLRFSPPADEPRLPREVRRALGAYYSPPEIVRLVVDLVLAPLLTSEEPPRVLDPACGAGEFLVETRNRLAARYDTAVASRAIHGIDIDPAAIRAARRRLRQLDPQLPASQLQQGDGLDASLLKSGPLDAIVGNPPFVSIRQLARTTPREQIDGWRRMFRTARGNFDLYVLFVERAVSLLRPGGRCGLIIPNKWATLDYARPLREMLLAETTLEDVIDLTGVRAFADAAVYPQVIVFRKEPPHRTHLVRYRALEDAPATGQNGGPNLLRQLALAAAAISFHEPLAVEARVNTRPLGEVATLACGTPGYAAQTLAARLIEASGWPATERAADFITSGNIDRYAIRLGHVRYLKHTYARPRLPLDVLGLSAERRRLFSSPKIVLAGLSQRLEAAWDDRGLALGVQVFAASDCQVDPFYLLALLNSKLLAYLFATRYAAKRLGGGYLAINKGQLARLPILVPEPACPRAARLSQFAQSLNRVPAASPAAGSLVQQPNVATDNRIDQVVYELYRLSSAEINRVEAHFAASGAKAA